MCFVRLIQRVQLLLFNTRAYFLARISKLWTTIRRSSRGDKLLAALEMVESYDFLVEFLHDYRLGYN